MPERLDVEQLTKDFERLQKQKFSRQTGSVEGRVLEAIAAAHGEHFTKAKGGVFRFTRSDSPVRIPFNFIGNRKQKLAGRISSIAPNFKAKPDTADPADRDQAQIVDKLVRALDDKVDQESVTREIIEWLLIGGMAVEYTPWVPNATQEPVPVRVEDVEGLQDFWERQGFQVREEDLVWRDKLSLSDEMEQGALVPNSVRNILILPPEEGGQGRAPEEFEVEEEVRPIGDVGSEVYGPLNVFVDASVRDLKQLAPDQHVSIAAPRTKAWVMEFVAKIDTSRTDVTAASEEEIAELKPDDNIKIVKTNLVHQGDSLAGLNLKDLLPAVQGSKGEDDPDMFVVVERFMTSSPENPEGRYTVFVPGKAVLRDGPNPYEDGIPMVDFHWEPVTTTFWTKGWATDLIPVNKAFDRHLSDVFDYMKKFGKSPWLLGGSLSLEDFEGDGGDVARVIEKGISPEGQKLVAQADVAQMWSGFIQSINNVKAALDDLAGGSDLFQESKFPGQLRGPLAVPMLQEILDTQYGPVFKHLGERLARVKQKRVNRVKQFYPPVRTLHYTSRNERDEVFTFHTQEILRAGTEYNITIERGSLVPELRAMREARLRERLESPLAVLYVDERTGAIDKSKIAADLEFGDTGRESREARVRKFSRDIIGMLWSGEQPPQVREWMDPGPMLDEFEEQMNDVDFVAASPQIQQGFEDYYMALLQLAQQRAQLQQQQVQQQEERRIMNEAIQQATARAQAETVDAAKDEIRSVVQTAVQQVFSNPEVLQNLFLASQDEVV